MTICRGPRSGGRRTRNNEAKFISPQRTLPQSPTAPAPSRREPIALCILPINQNLNGKLKFIELFSYVHFLPVSARNEPKKRHSRGRGSRIRFDILSPLRIPHTIGTGILLGSRISFLVCRKKAIYLMDKRKSLYMQCCLGSILLYVLATR